MVENTESEKRKLIGEKIRKARAWANLKQEDLGRALNLPGNVISRMEMGERAVRVSEYEAKRDLIDIFIRRIEIKPAEYQGCRNYKDRVIIDWY